jgi:hypothetical protein
MSAWLSQSRICTTPFAKRTGRNGYGVSCVIAENGVVATAWRNCVEGML